MMRKSTELGSPASSRNSSTDDTTTDDEACFVDFQPDNHIDFIALLPSEISIYILSLLPNHEDVLSCTLVSSVWNVLCQDSLVWRGLFHNRLRHGWQLIDNYEEAWHSIISNSRHPFDDAHDHNKGEDRSIASTPGRNRAVLVDDRPFSKPCHVGDVSLESVESCLTRTSIHSTGESADGIDWRAIYQARYCLTKRWSLQDAEPEAAVLDASHDMLPSTSTIVNTDGTWLIDPAGGYSLLTKPNEVSEQHSFEPIDQHITGHSDSVYCVRLDHKPFRLPAQVAASLQEGHDNGPLYDPITSLGLGSYGKIVSGSRDRTVRIWDGDSGLCLHTLQGHNGSVLCLEYDDDVLFSGSSDMTVIVWDLKMMLAGLSPKPIRQLRGHQGGILDLSIDDQWLISCGKDTTVRVYDRTQDCLLTRVYTNHSGPINSGTLKRSHVDGKTKAVTASGDGGVHLWDVETGTMLRTLVGHARGLACVKYLSDWIVTGSNDMTVRVWDAETGTCLCVCRGHENLVRAIAFDPQRKIVLTGGYDGKVQLYYVGRELHSDAVLATSGSVAQPFWNIGTGHGARVFDVQMDGSRILSCGEDDKICVRDFGRGVPLMRLFT